MMTRLTIATSAGLLLTSALPAFAAVAMGTVASISDDGNTLTLADGNVYSVKDISVAAIMVGDAVTVTYTVDGKGAATASDVSEVGGYR